MLNNFFIIPAVKENTRIKLALAISERYPIIRSKEIIDIPLHAVDKTIKD